MDIKVKIMQWSGDSRSEEAIRDFLKRPAIDPAADQLAREVLADIRARGDAAVAQWVEKFDGVILAPNQWQVKKAEINAARDKVDPDFVAAVREAHKRITAFSRAGMRKDWTMTTPRGGSVGEQFVPFDRIGIYVPGGAAPLASTALMTATLARVAGVQEVVACTPVGASKKVNNYLLYAMEAAGVSEIYKLGGIQAIGAMALGTETIRKVQKLVGPGGPYVTAAKRLVYGDVALDTIAGPSEIAILADETAVPENVAADLLSQAEHGTGQEKTLLVTTSSTLAVAVQLELARQFDWLTRKEPVAKVLNEGTLMVVVGTLDTGMELCNRFAPEHLEIVVKEPRIWLKKVRNAGAVFVGAWTPECAGDYIIGPSHVLPTGGAAAMFSGLTVDDFRKRISVASFTRADLADVLPAIDAFGRVEGLDAHARSARIRFGKP
jgi:histidinol dehydrogenase